MFIVVLAFNIHDSYAQLSRSQIKKNNSRLWKYRGNVKNKYGTAKRYATIGVSMGALNYYGDLSPSARRISTDISLSRPGLGFFSLYRMAPRLSAEVNIFYGSVQGSDNASADPADLTSSIYRYQRNLSFRNRIAESTIVLVVDLFENNGYFFDRPALAPYLFGGAGIMHHNPQARVPSYDLTGSALPQAGQWKSLRPLGTEGQYSRLESTDMNYGNKPYSLWQPVISMGIGMRLRLTDYFDLSTEISVRYLFTDYLDDVSKNYVDLGVFGTNELARAMSYRSNEVKPPTYKYLSSRDGKVYNVLPGYGSEHKDNIRGNRSDNDVYTAFLIKLSYGIPKFMKAKRR